MDEDLMAIEKRWAESMQGCAPGECLEADALLELAERGKRSRSYSERMAHIAICRSCRETFKLLQHVEVARPKPALGWLVQPRIGFALVAAAAAVLAIVFINQNGVQQNGARREAPVATTKTGGTENPIPTTQKKFVTPNKQQVAARTESLKNPRVEIPRKRKSRGGSRKPVTPEREPLEVPKGSMYAESTGQPGILEGEVVYTMVLEGQVERGEVLQGEVTAKPPPAPKSPPPLQLH